MRVLVLLPDQLEKPVGGIGIQLQYVIKHLPDVTFDVVGQPQTNSDLYTSVSNDFPQIGHASLIAATGQMQYFAEAIKRPKPDYVHAYDWSTYYAGYYTAEYFKVPLIVTMQLSINLLNGVGITYTQDPTTVDGHWINRIHCEMEKFGLEKADKIIQVSDGYASKFIGAEGKTSVIPNGIDLDDWKPKKEIKLKDKKNIVYIGRFASMKNIQALTKAKIPDGIHLYFVGNEKGGELFNMMKEFCDKEKNATYYGEAFGQDKIDLLSSADGVIIPSLHEPFGIVALEGLASKSVVLSSWVDGMSDFLNKENSIYCGTSPESIENAYYKFLSLSDDEKNSIITEGLKTCENYSWDRATNLMKKIYTKNGVADAENC